MTNDNKPPMFGPSSVIDSAADEPGQGKSALMNEIVSELAAKPRSFADAVIGNCTTGIQLKFEFDTKDPGHRLILGSTRQGMSALSDALEGKYAIAGGTLQVLDKGKTGER